MAEWLQHQSGLILPKPKPAPPPEKVRPDTWNCPRCGYYYDFAVESAKGPIEEATVGSIGPNTIPHINCPECDKCMGCGIGKFESDEEIDSNA